MNKASFAFGNRALLCAVAAASFATPASAQTINYTALSDLFGEPVTTSATGTPQRAGEVAADMVIITADQIRQSGSRAIPEILGMYVPGVTVMQEGVNQYDVGMRGYQAPYNSRLLVLIDGRQVFNDDYSRTEWDNLPINIDDIQQIEVVKGTNSALFGSNATSGVVNIITYSPIYDNNRVVSAQFGTQDTWQGDATVTQKISNIAGVKISAGGLEDKEFLGTAQQRAPATRTLPSIPVDYTGERHPYHDYVDANGDFKVNPAVTLFGELSYTHKSSNEVVPLYKSYPIDGTTYSARGGWVFNSALGTIKNDNYVNYQDIKYGLGSTFGVGTPVNDEKQNSLIVSRLEDMFDVGSAHTFRAMLEYRHKNSTFSNTDFTLYDNPTMDQNVYTLGGTWLWHIRENLSLTNAVRYDLNETDALEGTLDPASPYTKASFSREFPAFSVNSGLVYNLTDADIMRATYSRGVQNSSLFSTGDDFNFTPLPGVTYIYHGAPSIKPTQVQNYGLGYERTVPEILSAVNVTAFYENSHNMVAEGPASITADRFGRVTISQQEQNVGDSHGYGAELSLDGHNNAGTRWNVSYSYEKVHDSALALRFLDFQKSAPQHQFRVNVGQTLGKWEMDGHGQYMSPTSMLRDVNDLATPQQIYTGSYFTLGARVAYSVLDNLTLALMGSNLSGATTVENPYTKIDRRIFLDATLKF